ncbi:MAG: heparinase II/III domain-containing protein, partial [Chloroflexota bacterium]
MVKDTASNKQPDVLGSLFTAQRVHEHLLPREVWRPFPVWEARETWGALPAKARARSIERAEQQLGAPWPDLPATLFLEFRREGNRSRYEARHFARRTALTQLVLGECVEGQGRFLDPIVNGIWALCEESFWGVPAHSYSPRFPGTELPDTAYRVVDLFAAETGALLAWTHYLLGRQIEAELPVVTDRIVREVQERILEPYRTIDDWRWLGKTRRPVNNWNPWIHSNVLACDLLLEADAAVREATVLRVIEGLDAFLDGYHADGGCDEGTSYWGRAGASLFDCLELLHSASDGSLDAFDLPLVQEIGRYIYRMHVGGTWYVNFADGSARVALDADLVYRYGARIGDPKMMAQGASALAQRREPPARGASIGRALRELVGYAELASANAEPPLVRDAWLEGIQVLVA